MKNKILGLVLVTLFLTACSMGTQTDITDNNLESSTVVVDEVIDDEIVEKDEVHVDDGVEVTKDEVVVTEDKGIDQMALPEIGEEILVIETNFGEIKARLFSDVIPETHKNFIFHVNEGSYDGTIFHRVISDFMIQGGDIEGLDGRGGYSYKGNGTTIAEEFHKDLSHVEGALSMAKTEFPSTTGSQFFIVQAKDGTPWLDNAHSVFGQVFEGMDSVNEIAKVEVAPFNAKPIEEVKLIKAYLTKYEG